MSESKVEKPWVTKSLLLRCGGVALAITLAFVGFATCRNAGEHERRISPVNGSGPGGGVLGR